MTLKKKLGQLEQWVEKMESEETDLDETIRCYSKAAALVKEIQTQLSEKAKEIDVLTHEL